MRLSPFLASLALAASVLAQHNTLAPDESSDGWALLFDGRSLEGWITSGNMDAWLVKEGELHTTGKGGWWLRTERMYRDFELKLDFNVPEKGNSGVGLRCSATGDPAFTGMELQIYDSAGAHASLSHCGAVYNAIAPKSQAVHPAGEWNTYHVRLVGDTLDVWLNDEHIHQAQKLDGRGFFRASDQPIPLNARLPTGYISLQDHGNPVRFRNLKLKDLSPDPDPGGFEPILQTPTDLSGWKPRADGRWSADEDQVGAVIFSGQDGPGHLYSPETYADVDVRGFCRVSTRGNGGLYTRAAPPPDNPDSWPLGYEAQVDNHDPNNWTGCIYGKAHPERGYRESLLTRDNAWFDYRVRIEGARIQTWINGVRMVDAEVTGFDRGHVALQTHHPGNRIEWRELQARRLDADERESEVTR